MRAELRRARGQQLHPQADAQDRPPGGGDLAQRLRQPALAQPRDRVPERADARDHHAFGGQHLVRLRDQLRLDPDVLEGVQHGADVPHAVVDDDGHTANTQNVTSSQGPSSRERKPSSTQLQLREALLVEAPVVGAEQRALLPAVGDLLDVVGAVLAAQDVLAGAAHDLVHHRRQLRRRLMDQHAGREHEVERAVLERQLARLRHPHVDARGCSSRRTSSACSLTSMPATFSGPEQLGEPARVAAQVAPDLERRARNRSAPPAPAQNGRRPSPAAALRST